MKEAFKLLVRNRMYASAQLYAFDLLELDGEDLRGEPIEVRKNALNRLLRKDRGGLLISQPIDAPVDVAFEQVCQLGLEGIVSKRLGSKIRDVDRGLARRMRAPLATKGGIHRPRTQWRFVIRSDDDTDTNVVLRAGMRWNDGHSVQRLTRSKGRRGVRTWAPHSEG
jgi:hypothetical protein